MNDNGIIAAIATAPGHGAIGIIRMSGSGVMELLGRIFLPRKNEKMKSHRMYYGNICKNGEIIDEVMVCSMLSPHSYTREDTVEIYAHGGMIVLKSVLDAVISEGAQLAEPGEFTKRAFLNGRINLTQAEAVMDLINAGSETARRAGLRQLGGGLTKRIENVRNTILAWLAHIELSIDYPEHEEEAKTVAQILAEGGEVIKGMEALYKTAEVGRILRDGIKTAIIGKPNVGKSTLLNAILSEDRAIVHEIAGTTRDILTERVVVGGVPLVLMDTAGIRETEDPVEKIGVEKSLMAAEEAELVLYMVDAQEYKGDWCLPDVSRLLDSKQVIVLVNKCDLLTVDEVQNRVRPVINVSALTGEGLDQLYMCIHELFLSGLGSSASEPDIITRERHLVLIEAAISHVKNAMSEIAQGVPEDLVSVGLRAAYMALGHILGVEVADDILDRIFMEFCVGK